MTRLITIDYTEYLDLIKYKNINDIKINDKVIDSLIKLNNELQRNINDKFITKANLAGIFRFELNRLKNINEILKEEVNND